ncbi:MAG: RsmE family RNA methyltransferase [Actinomycetota bacterium]
MAPRPSGPYFFADPASISENRLTLSGADARHLAVRRARPGEIVHVGDGAGTIFEARLESIEANEVAASILSARQVQAPSPGVTVLQGLAKGTKVDWVVEKLVELGVDRVAVFTSGRSVPVWDRAKAEAAAQRWQRIALAAAKQSRRAWLPEVPGPLTTQEAVQLVERASMALVAAPKAELRLRQAIDGEPPTEVLLVVGPEGGLADHEVDAFVGAGATAVDLGSQILRTETAGLALAAAVMFHFGRFG